MSQLRFRDWLAGLLILMAGPLIVIGCLWGWTAWRDAAPQAGPLTSWLDRAISWTGDPVRQNIRFAPPPRSATPAAPIGLDLLVMVDVSGSTHRFRPALNDAILRLASDLLTGPASINRIAVVSFAVDATVEVDWTADRSQLPGALARLVNMHGMNDSRAAFDVAARVIGAARPNARHVIAIYTDGYITECDASCPKPLFDWDDIALASRQLRDRGNEIFAIGLPAPAPFESQMIRVTGKGENILLPDTGQDLSRLLRQVATNPADVLSPSGAIEEQVDGRLFDIANDPAAWSLDGAELRHELLPVMTTPETFSAILYSKISGLMATSAEPIRLRYIDPVSSQSVSHQSAVPELLAISPEFLIFAFLPALIWTIYYLFHLTPPVPEREAAAVPFRLPREPAQGPPPLPFSDAGSRPEVPTLFIGAGGWGIDALAAMRRELLEVHGDGLGPPYQFLAIDVDDASRSVASRAGLTSVAPPAAICQTASYIDTAVRSGRQYAPLNLAEYRNVGQELLNITNGSHGDRRLARLAFLRWLETGGLVAELKDHLDALAAMEPAPGGLRQIVILTRMAGGFGGAVALELARILRRMARDGQGAHGFVPECVVVAEATATDPAAQARLAAFTAEYQTMARFRRYPRRVTLVPGDALLDRVDAEAPSESLLTLSGDLSGGHADTATQAATLGGVLVDPVPRRDLLAEIDARMGGGANVATAALGVRHSQVRRLIAEEFLTRFLGVHLLGGVVAKPDGTGYAAAVVTEADAEQGLSRLMADEPAASPWSRLLRSVGDSAAAEGFLETLDPHGAGNLEWLRAAFAHALTEMLTSPDAARRQNGPAFAVAALTLLAARLKGPIRSRASSLGAANEVLAVLDDLAALLTGLATELNAWMSTLLDAVNAAYTEKSRLLTASDGAGGSLMLIGERLDEAGVGRMFDDAMAQWLGSEDKRRILETAPFDFAIVVDGDHLAVVLRGRMGQRTQFRAAADGVEAMRSLAERIVRLTPGAWLDTAIAGLDPESARRCAAHLTGRPGPVAGSLLALPWSPDPATAAAVEAFRGQVAEPLGQRRRLDSISRDRIRMRQIWLSEQREPRPMRGALPVVQPIDVTAQRTRLRIEHLLERAIPAFPPELSLALSDRRGFEVFALAYRTGNIQRRTDGSGRQSWFVAGPGVFLTEGEEGLAAAAASFVQDETLCAMQFHDTGTAADFALLDEWLASRPGLSAEQEADLVTLAAIRDVGQEGQ